MIFQLKKVSPRYINIFFSFFLDFFFSQEESERDKSY